jgi:hypothetical protein
MLSPKLVVSNIFCRLNRPFPQIFFAFSTGGDTELEPLLQGGRTKPKELDSLLELQDIYLLNAKVFKEFIDCELEV